MKKTKMCMLQVVFFILNILEIRSEFCALDDDFRRSYLGLALTPIQDEKQKPRIKIIWVNDNLKTGDAIILFSHDQWGFRILYELKPRTAYGTDETGLEYHFEGDESLYDERCKKYYAAWVRNSYIRDITCISSRPTWMYDRRAFLGSASLADLFIPGTYHSGTYDFSSMSIWDRIIKGNMIPHLKSQQSSVLSQLMDGIRYIHLTVGYHADNKDTVFWVHRDNFAVTKLDTVIDQVNTFLSNTREIVIVDVENFPEGFDNKGSYERLIEYLRMRFARHLLPPEFTARTPLSKIWKYARSLSYPPLGRMMLNVNLNRTSFDCSQIQNSFIKHNFINARTLVEYFAGLGDAECEPIQHNDAHLKVTFAEFNRIFFDGYNAQFNDLSVMADQTNEEVTIWYHKFWNNFANIVAVDFFESSGIVDVAIRANEFKFRKRSSKESTPNCTLPYLPSDCPFHYMIYSRQITKYLVPRVTRDVVEKIYDQLKDSDAVIASNPYVVALVGKCTRFLKSKN